MTATVNWRDATRLRADRRALALLALFAVVLAAALALRPALVASGTQSAVDGASTAEQAAGGAGWGLLATVEAVALLGLLALWRRAPAWLRRPGRATARYAAWLFAGLWLVAVFGLPTGFAIATALFFAARAADATDLWWVVNDALALALAIGFGAGAGILLGPVVVGVGLVALSVYDYAFADREDWMFTLATWTMRNRLPALFVVPTTLRVDWDELAAEADDELPMGFGIGMADLALPAAFAVALAHGGGGLPLWGAIGGTLAACFRLSAKMHEGSGAGMPPLTTGALGGWAIATVAALVVALP